MQTTFWWDFADNSVILESSDDKCPVIEIWEFKESDLRKVSAKEKIIYDLESDYVNDASKYIEEAEKLISDFESGRLSYKKYSPKGNVPSYRVRRGKSVEIPKKWLGNITTKQTKRIRKQLALEKRLERKKKLKLEKEFDESSYGYSLNDLMRDNLKNQIAKL